MNIQLLKEKTAEKRQSISVSSNQYSAASSNPKSCWCELETLKSYYATFEDLKKHQKNTLKIRRKASGDKLSPATEK